MEGYNEQRQRVYIAVCHEFETIGGEGAGDAGWAVMMRVRVRVEEGLRCRLPAFCRQRVAGWHQGRREGDWRKGIFAVVALGQGVAWQAGWAGSVEGRRGKAVAELREDVEHGPVEVR